MKQQWNISITLGKGCELLHCRGKGEKITTFALWHSEILPKTGPRFNIYHKSPCFIYLQVPARCSLHCNLIY